MDLKSLRVKSFNNSTGIEEIILMGKVGEYVITSFGRVYINPNIDYIKILSNQIRIKDQTITIPQPRNICYVSSEVRATNLSEIKKCLKICSYFFKELIEKNVDCPFEKIDFRSLLCTAPFIGEVSFNNQIKYSLLKPVYYRYMSTKRNNPKGINKIRMNLSYENWYDLTIKTEKMTLFDVPCDIKDSQLNILGICKVYLGEGCFDCLSLGAIDKIDKIEIEFGETSTRKQIMEKITLKLS